MRFWNKEFKQKADKRVQTMETSLLAGWMDSTLMNIHMAFDEWRFRNGEKERISEAITALNSIWEELEQRPSN